MISDKELQRLRMQSEFNSFGTRAPEEWRKMAEALAELEQRRQREQKQETT